MLKTKKKDISFKYEEVYTLQFHFFLLLWLLQSKCHCVSFKNMYGEVDT